MSQLGFGFCHVPFKRDRIILSPLPWVGLEICSCFQTADLSKAASNQERTWDLYIAD